MGVLETETAGKIHLYVAEGTLLHATGLVPLALLRGNPRVRPSRDRKAEVQLLADILAGKGWYEAFRLATLQVVHTLQAIPGLPGKKRFSFASHPVPEVLKRIGGGVRLTPRALSLFFPSMGEEWDFED